ncbi:MAG: hypothetical protein ACR2FJ_08645 [Qipengyuania sp.]
MRFITTASVLALIAAQPVLAQEVPQLPDAGPDPSEESAPATAGDVIIVQGQRLRGQLDVDQPPIVEYNAQDIKAFGADSIADVLEQLAPATGSSRGRGGGGRPVILLNGVRVGSFREFRSYPPEAIEKVEVFPEEVAQRFGYSADQRVVNIILKDNYASREIEIDYKQPDRGGFRRTDQEVNFLTISDGARINAEFETAQRTILTEDERDLQPVAGGLSDVATDANPLAYRSLIGRIESYQGELSYARAFIESGSSVSGNLTASRNLERSLSGLDTVTLVAPDGSSAFRVFNEGDPLMRDKRSDALQTSGSFNKPLGAFQFTATADAGVTDTRTLIERRLDTDTLVAIAATGALGIDAAIPALPDAGRDRSESRLWSASSLATLRGAPLELPAGEVNTTFDLGYDWDRIESNDTRTAQDTSLTRGNLSGGVNLAIPVASTRTGAWDAMGGLSLNAQAGFDYLSDFGTLADWSLGATWSPFENLTFSATRIWREVAPGLTELGNPVGQEFNVPTFDFATGESVLATVLTGGNPALLAETQADWKFSANWELPFWERARLQIDYAINNSDDVTLASPSITSAFEAAFPERVTRSPAGELLATDRRPVTLFETRNRQLSFGFNANGQIGSPPPEPEPSSRGGAGGSGAGEAQGEGRRGGPPGGRGFGPERFAEMRKKFCATPEGEMPDLTGIPEQMLARLRGEDGQLDPAKVQEARERFCGEEAEERQRQFAAMREMICAEPPRLDGLPDEVLARLRGEDGQIDPERLAQMRKQMCRPGGEGTQTGEGQQQGRGGGGRRGGVGAASFFGGGRDRDPRPRYFFSLNHTIQLENEVLLAAGGPVFDQLDGFVIAGGAIPRHTSRLEAGLFMQGYGLRLSGRYAGEAELRGSGLPGSSDLFFGDLATFDLRLFADLGEVLEKDSGVLDDLRVSLRADNIFDARRRVTDANGDVPLAFQPFRLDPIGRYLGIELRKLF